MGNFIDMVGKKRNRLTLLEYAGKTRHGQKLWLCECECGNRKII